MKRVIFAVSLSVSCVCLGVVGTVVAHAVTAPSPEIDRANANIQLGGNLTPVTCPGEDTLPTGAPTPYVTYTGTWTGSEGQLVPDPTDYPLSGSLTVSGIRWTINLNTGRGVLTGKAILTTPGTTKSTYSGKLTLVTQGDPSSTAAPAIGRGWLSAAIQLPDEAVSPGDDSLIANVEFPNLNAGGATGWFGDLPGAPRVPDFSAVTNVAPIATDGVC